MFRNHQQVERTLEVELTPEELLGKGRELSSAIIERLRIKNKAKYAAEGFTAEIKLFEQQIETLGMLVSEGKEFRKVKCVERITESGIEVEMTRLDTGELVGIRPMTAEERQESLFDDTPVAKLDTRDSAESMANAAAFLGVSELPKETVSLVEEADAFIGGTPHRTVISLNEINQLARHTSAIQIHEELPLKIAYDNGTPLVVIAAANPREDGSGWGSLTAWHCLPETVTGVIEQTDADREVSCYKNRRVNAGKKKSPVWWYLVGPEINFTVEQDVQALTERILFPTPEEATEE